MNYEPSQRDSVTCTSYRSDPEQALLSRLELSQHMPLLGSSLSGVLTQGILKFMLASNEATSAPPRTRNIGDDVLCPKGTQRKLCLCIHTH